MENWINERFFQTKLLEELTLWNDTVAADNLEPAVSQ